MPFIAGLISREAPEFCNQLVERMVTTMLHEKFYVTGTHAVPELGIYAGWGAHEGSFCDGQPGHGSSKDVTALLAGECFVEPAVIARLRQRGHDVDGHHLSWLPYLYEERGENVFADLNGLFSGLLIDGREKCAFLFNDRY